MKNLFRTTGIALLLSLSAVSAKTPLSNIPVSTGTLSNPSPPRVPSNDVMTTPVTTSALEVTTKVCAGGGLKGGNLKLSTKSAVIAAVALAFNSGYINGACLSGMLAMDGTKQAAAAVTGGWTNAALGIASGSDSKVMFNAKCILSYFGGSMISGVLNPKPVSFEVSREKVAPLFAIGAALMYMASVSTGKNSKNFIFLAAIANGLQNSITSTTTANLCRTAHMSGMTSDLGTFIGQYLRGNKQNVLKIKVFASILASFSLGGISSYYMTKEYTAKSLLFNAALFLAVAMGVTFY